MAKLMRDASMGNPARLSARAKPVMLSLSLPLRESPKSMMAQALS
jgi:hypothetical protein